MVEIYTDGAVSGNPGKGGAAAIVIKDNKKIMTIMGSEDNTTNQRMELYGVLLGLKYVNKIEDVVIYSDSAYFCNAFKQHWIDNWQKNGWINSKKEPVANQDLWKEILEYIPEKFDICKVKGHNGNELNEMADQAAVYARLNLQGGEIVND